MISLRLCGGVSPWPIGNARSPVRPRRFAPGVQLSTRRSGEVEVHWHSVVWLGRERASVAMGATPVGRKNSIRIPPDRPAGSRARSGGSVVEHLRRELAAVLAGHGLLEVLDDGQDRTSIVLELCVSCDSPDPSRLLSPQRECSISPD